MGFQHEALNYYNEFKYQTAIITLLCEYFMSLNSIYQFSIAGLSLFLLHVPKKILSTSHEKRFSETYMPVV